MGGGTDLPRLDNVALAQQLTVGCEVDQPNLDLPLAVGCRVDAADEHGVSALAAPFGDVELGKLSRTRRDGARVYQAEQAAARKIGVDHRGKALRQQRLGCERRDGDRDLVGAGTDDLDVQRLGPQEPRE